MKERKKEQKEITKRNKENLLQTVLFAMAIADVMSFPPQKLLRIAMPFVFSAPGI